jgi:hypothetical protein
MDDGFSPSFRPSPTVQPGPGAARGRLGPSGLARWRAGGAAGALAMPLTVTLEGRQSRPDYESRDLSKSFMTRYKNFYFQFFFGV